MQEWKAWMGTNMGENVDLYLSGNDRFELIESGVIIGYFTPNWVAWVKSDRSSLCFLRVRIPLCIFSACVHAKPVDVWTRLDQRQRNGTEKLLVDKLARNQNPILRPKASTNLGVAESDVITHSMPRRYIVTSFLSSHFDNTRQIAGKKQLCW